MEIFINHVDMFLDIFDPLTQLLGTILFNKAYVVVWTFGTPPSPPACHVNMVMNVPFWKNLPLQD